MVKCSLKSCRKKFHQACAAAVLTKKGVELHFCKAHQREKSKRSAVKKRKTPANPPPSSKKPKSDPVQAADESDAAADANAAAEANAAKAAAESQDVAAAQANASSLLEGGLAADANAATEANTDADAKSAKAAAESKDAAAAQANAAPLLEGGLAADAKAAAGDNSTSAPPHTCPSSNPHPATAPAQKHGVASSSFAERIHFLHDGVDAIAFTKEQVDSASITQCLDRIEQQLKLLQRLASEPFQAQGGHLQLDPNVVPVSWDMQAFGGHEIGFESPMLRRQVQRECSFTMDATYQSLKLRNWGFGVDADFQSLPKDWITNEFVSACLGVFALFGKDVFFISPFHCDSISLSDNPLSWSKEIQKSATNCKCRFVAAVVSLRQKKHLMRVDGNEGYHWIVVIGDSLKKESFCYDPNNNEIKETEYVDELSILDRFMTLSRGMTFVFTKCVCPFKIQCQIGDDSVHCGIWSLTYLLNWCLDSLEKYEIQVVTAHQDKRLLELAVYLRHLLYSDLVRHGLLDIALLHWKSPMINVSNPSNFWILTPILNIDSALNQRYGSSFQEFRSKCHSVLHLSADKVLRPDSFSSSKPLFFCDGRKCVKVRRFLWGKVHQQELASVLHECAATAYVCAQKKWYCEIFGVVNRGASATYVHFCICRTQLDFKMVDPQTTSSAIESLYGSTGVVHGDGHSANVKKSMTKDEVEVVDCERSFFANSDVETRTVVDRIRDYAKPQAHLSEILSQMKLEGMDRTRLKFLKIADDVMAGSIDLCSLQIGSQMFLATKPKKVSKR